MVYQEDKLREFSLKSLRELGFGHLVQMVQGIDAAVDGKGSYRDVSADREELRQIRAVIAEKTGKQNPSTPGVD